MRWKALLLCCAIFAACAGALTVAHGQPSPTEDSASQVKIVEADGLGATELEARKAAVTAAIESAAGVYIDARRSSELRMTDAQIHDMVSDKVQTYSSAFVEKVETLSASRSGQDYAVRVRAYVIVSGLLDAMKQADIPVNRLDAVSIQTKLATQLNRAQSAEALLSTAMEDTSRLYTFGFENLSVSLVPGHSDVAELRGTLAIGVNAAVLQEFDRLYDVFTEEIPPNRNAPGSVVICKMNAAKQVSGCRGTYVEEEMVRKFAAPHGSTIVVQLFHGGEELTRAAALLRDVCEGFERVGLYNDHIIPFFSGATLASPTQFYPNDFNRHSEPEMMTKLALGSLKRGRSEFLTLDRPQGATRQDDGGVCYYKDPLSPEPWLTVYLLGQSRTFKRNFVLFARRSLLTEVDGLRAVMVGSPQ